MLIWQGYSLEDVDHQLGFAISGFEELAPCMYPALCMDNPFGASHIGGIGFVAIAEQCDAELVIQQLFYDAARTRVRVGEHDLLLITEQRPVIAFEWQQRPWWLWLGSSVAAWQR